MDLQQLRYLRTVVQEGSLTRAAKTLGVTQPTLSVAIRRLEEDLGITLLVRGRDGVRPTPAGTELAVMAMQVLADVEAISRRVRELDDGLRGKFVLGCYESLGAYFLPGFLSAFMRDYPEIELTLWNGTSAEVRDAVIDGRIDFGVVVNTVPHPDLVILAAFHDVIEVFATRPAETLEDAIAWLRGEPVLYIPRSPFDAILDRLAAIGGLGSRRIECGDLELAKSLTLAGVGAGVLPRRVASYGHDGKIVPVHPGLPSFQDTIHVVYRPEAHRTRAAQAVKDALIAHGRRLDQPQ